MLNGSTPVLVSWAVPKGLPRRRGDRHLAIRTEDHPMGYASFSGTIPENEYGGGQVRIFDEGTYEMEGRSDDRITFRLNGARLQGVWHLVSTGTEKGKEQWLALLSADERPPGDHQPPTDPMLATLTGGAFDDPEWLFEPKWDGIRALAICSDSTRLPELARLDTRVVALDAILDGEIVALDEGVPSFQKLQQRMHLRDDRKIEQMMKTIPVAYMVFDILFLDRTDLTAKPLIERRRILEELIVPSQQIQLSPVTPETGIALYEAAAKTGLEGIMAKRALSIYSPGSRSRDWLKVKVTFDADVVIAGWTEGEGRRAGTLGSLVMAVYDGPELRYVGNVGTGFDARSLAETMERVGSLDEVDAQFPGDVIRSRAELRRAHWVEPSLVASVEHRQLTDAGRLRAPSFKGFRDDKTPAQCTWEQLMAEAQAASGP
jgi:bifunctional non-homologous end joining protein LigD